MAFQELIKNFDRLRDYMRDFFIYGYKTRSDHHGKSVRTYDNERRRIESYLGDYMCFRVQNSPEGGRGKQVWLSMESGVLARNPLYQAYRCKSFTDNDIILHFFLMEILSSSPPPQKEGWTAGALADELSKQYGLCFDVQTVRGKLKEYTDPEKGLCFLTSEKSGKNLCYRLNSEQEPLSRLLEEYRGDQGMEDFLAYFSETAPFGVIGSYIMDREGFSNPRIRFKHHFLAHTLDDNILLAAAEAIASGEMVEITNFGRRQMERGSTAQPIVCTGVPIAVLISVQTGRRYLVLYGDKRNKFHSFRLDYIRSIKRLGISPPDLEDILRRSEECLNAAWGSAITWRPKRERLSMELFIDEKREKYILQRLRREGRGGTVEQVGPNRFRYTIVVSDTNELMEWVKTFTGRICKLEGDNPQVIRRFYSDMERMAKLYGEGCEK